MLIKQCAAFNTKQEWICPRESWINSSNYTVVVKLILDTFSTLVHEI